MNRLVGLRCIAYTAIKLHYFFYNIISSGFENLLSYTYFIYSMYENYVPARKSSIKHLSRYSYPPTFQRTSTKHLSKLNTGSDSETGGEGILKFFET